MGFLLKSDVINAIHEDMETSLMCYNDNLTKDVIQFCYQSVEREIDRLTQYRLDNVAEVDEKSSKVIDYIFNNLHWCPFKDEADIDFEKECVGFREKGCKECIYRNIDKLN